MRELTQLGEVMQCETRWNIKYKVIKRYFRIEIGVRWISTLDRHMQAPAQSQEIEKHLPNFEDFASVSTNYNGEV